MVLTSPSGISSEARASSQGETRLGATIECAEASEGGRCLSLTKGCPPMRWVITLAATREDAERLVASSVEDLSPHETEAGELILELQDSFGDESTDETRAAIRRDIELR